MSLPLNIVTGFLGCGKSTLIKRLLAQESLGETILLINEFGEIGIDNLLVEEVAPDLVLLPGGCVCCAIQGDLKRALFKLQAQRENNEIPCFQRVLLETSGLANIPPLLSVLKEPQLRRFYHLALVTTLVDAQHALQQSRLHPEWLNQVSAADRLLISKRHLVNQAQIEQIEALLASINPTVPVADVENIVDGAHFFASSAVHGTHLVSEISQWVFKSKPLPDQHHEAHVCSFEFDNTIDWVLLGVWLSLLLKCHGEKVLRVKGILAITGLDTPVVIHGVQHYLHMPVHLSAWPSEYKKSIIVFITRGLEIAQLRRSFCAFLGIQNE